MNLTNILTVCIYTIITCFLTILLGKIGLPFLTKHKAGQHIRDEGPISHQVKTGTPTMGGWFFILSILAVSLLSNLFFGGTPVSLWFYTMSLVGYAMVGFIDDYRKIILKQNLGLSAWQKLVLQIIVVLLIFSIFQRHFDDSMINFMFFQLRVPWVVYILCAVFWFVGFSNATNVTDGLDGLLTITASLAFTTFGILALLQGSLGTAVFCFTVLGGLLGFLFFNRHPAKVFMGDTGSLAIGALLAAISIELDAEIYLLILGIVFVVETTSVILQVLYFKYTKRMCGEGKRLFLMSPFHHHLELKGLKERQIVRRLTCLGFIGSCVTIILWFVSQ